MIYKNILLLTGLLVSSAMALTPNPIGTDKNGKAELSSPADARAFGRYANVYGDLSGKEPMCVNSAGEAIGFMDNANCLALGGQLDMSNRGTALDPDVAYLRGASINEFIDAVKQYRSDLIEQHDRLEYSIARMTSLVKILDEKVKDAEGNEIPVCFLNINVEQAFAECSSANAAYNKLTLELNQEYVEKSMTNIHDTISVAYAVSAEGGTLALQYQTSYYEGEKVPFAYRLDMWSYSSARNYGEWEYRTYYDPKTDKGTGLKFYKFKPYFLSHIDNLLVAKPIIVQP